MSSSPPSVPSRAPTPPSPGNENVAAWSAYEDRQQEYERRRDAHHVWELARAQVLRASQMVAPGAGPGSVATVPLAPGQILVVPPSERVAMGDAPPDAVDRALRRPRGPPTREWCQANSPCSHCARRRVPCVFLDLDGGSRRDVSMCKACRSKHERCSTSRLWKAQCVAREQGWDLAWVWAQMGEKTEVRMGEPQQAGPGGSPSAPVVLVGSHANKGKRKAAPSLGPVRRVRRRASPVHPVAEAGPSGPPVLSPVSGHPIPALEAMRTRLEEAQAEAARSGGVAAGAGTGLRAGPGAGGRVGPGDARAG
ncbi:hypothetical protein C0992_010390 [Termitomyces sp. T32_za158]|nr:hypothetical protein C0992_010390 [Termitomyces sp. T32_za158]